MKLLITVNIWFATITIHPLTWYLIPIACHNFDGDGHAPIHHRGFWKVKDDWHHTNLEVLCFDIDISK